VLAQYLNRLYCFLLCWRFVSDLCKSLAILVFLYRYTFQVHPIHFLYADYWLIFIFTMTQQPPVGQGLLIVEDSLSYSDTPHSVGLLWTSDHSDAETSTWQHTTLKRDRHSCPRRDSIPQSQQASGRRPTTYTARPLGTAEYWLNKVS